MSEEPTTRRHVLGLLATSTITTTLAADAQGGGGSSTVESGAGGSGHIESNLAAYRLQSDGRDWQPTLSRAFDALSSTRTAYPGYPRWGVGILHAERGVLPIDRPFRFSESQVGFGIVGAGRFATVFTKRVNTGEAFLLNPSSYCHFSDFTIVNETPTDDSKRDDAAFNILGTNGGHMTMFSRIVFGGFSFGIVISGETNGDFTHVVSCEFGTNVGYSNKSNKNAVSAGFDGCSFGCAGSAFLLGGSGEVTMRGGGANLHRSLVEYAEGAGINGVYPQSVAIDHVKLEYSGTRTSGAERLLIDGRQCALSPDQGGADTVTILRDTTLVLGDNPPGPPVGPAYDDHTIIDLAGGRHRVHAWGGYLRGTIRYSSNFLENQARWLFGRMRGAPKPSRLQLVGAGTHPLMEWWGNEGVADQYRGGQSGLRSIRTGTALLWRHTSNCIVNTGVAATPFRQADGSLRYGSDFTIDLAELALPPLITIEGLALYIKSNDSNSSTKIEWFYDAAFSVIHDAALVDGQARGKIPLSKQELTLCDGKLRLRITKQAKGDNGTIGAVVIYYFPYLE